MNEKMQPKTKVSHRRWQRMANYEGDYYYGECPRCGGIGDAAGDVSSGENHIQHEWFHCENCNIDFYYQTTTSYRYGGIERGSG